MNSTQQSYDILKCNLMPYMDKNHAQVIMFVGCAKGDGVSTTTLGFAENLASGSNDNVLLIDVNFRDPHLQHRFKIDNSRPSLANILIDGRQPLPMKIGTTNLHIIPCGSSRFGTQAIFEPIRFGQFLAEMKNRFAYVILDAPPILSAPEILSIASNVDATVMVIKSGITRREIVKISKQKIEEAGGNIAGVILNKRKYYIPKSVYHFFLGH